MSDKDAGDNTFDLNPNLSVGESFPDDAIELSCLRKEAGIFGVEDSDDSFSAEEENELGNGGDADEIAVSPDAVLLHIDEKFEGIDQVPKQPASVFDIPSDELIEKIVQQVEYYFSDGNIVQDEFLLRNLDKLGFVNIRLINSFKKMKKLTNDLRVTAYALEKSSTKLVLHKNKTKVKRIDPLPDIIRTPAVDSSKMVVVTCLPTQSVVELKELFQQCGNVVKVKVVESENKLPRQFKDLFKQKRNICAPLALVEYDSIESAEKASRTLTNTADWRKGIRVELLGKPIRKVDQKDKENKNETASAVNTETKKKQQKKKKKKTASGKGTEADQHLQSTALKAGLESEEIRDNPMDRSHAIPVPASQKGKGGASPKHSVSPANSPRSVGIKFLTSGSSPRGQDAKFLSSSFGPSNSSPARWVQRKLFDSSKAGGGSGPISVDSNRSEASQRKMLPEGVVRLPLGPDDSKKGFSLRRTFQ